MSGLFGGLAGNQGGLRAAGLLAFELPPRAFLATSTAVALLVDLARTPVYLLRAGPQLWALALPTTIAGVGCLLGTVWGERLLGRISAATYRRLVGAGVAAVGVWQGLPRSGRIRYRSTVAATPRYRSQTEGTR
jgi:uncharacterized membrane protein YfcA